ncbi:c-type cytochrome [Solirhodobacter olei]|uniref:c-type cytochrome n=1 Tax=Solirhodobacter olei TaxID=2493082 RepID=UPI0019D49E68|nr:cytochrome c [Solirhodobacter olei]
MRSATKFISDLTIPLIAAGAVALSASSALAVGNAATGKRLFLAHCAVCHKRDASGGVSLGDTKSADLQSPGLENQYHHDDKLMERAIMDGIDEEGGPLDTIMPRWGKVANKLSLAQVDDIIAYLKTVKTKD